MDRRIHRNYITRALPVYNRGEKQRVLAGRESEWAAERDLLWIHGPPVPSLAGWVASQVEMALTFTPTGSVNPLAGHLPAWLSNFEFCTFSVLG